VTLPRVLGSWARFVLLKRQELALGEDSALAARQLAAAAALAHLTEDLLHDVEGRETDIDGSRRARGDGVDRSPPSGESDIDGRAEVVVGEPV